MLNEHYILQCIEPYLNAKREISEFEFFELFAKLTTKEHYEIVNIMIRHGIEYVDEKEEDAASLAPVGQLIQAAGEKDHTHYLHLTNEQLAVIAQQGDKAAAMALIEKNKRFIYQVVKRQIKRHARIHVTEEDLFQEGCIGLLKAITRYDPSLDYYFLTYGEYWIRQTIVRSIVDEGYMIRLPAHTFEKVTKISGYRQRYPALSRSELIDLIIHTEAEAGKTVSRREIVKYFMLADYYLNTTSLNDFVGDQGDTELMSFMPDDGEDSVEEIIERKELSEILSRLLHTLTPREEAIIKARYGFGTDNPMTLEALGNDFKVTRERIRQIEAKALRKLRQPCRCHCLRGHREV